MNALSHFQLELRVADAGADGHRLFWDRKNYASWTAEKRASE